MEIEKIITEINNIFRDVLENESLVINAETNAKNVEEWDSLNHIQLVVAIEKHFKFRFTSSEIQGWKNVGEMCESISNKLAN